LVSYDEQLDLAILKDDFGDVEYGIAYSIPSSIVLNYISEYI